MLNPTDTRLDRIAHDLGRLIEGYDSVLHSDLHPELRSVLHRQRDQLEHQYHEVRRFSNVSGQHMQQSFQGAQWGRGEVTGRYGWEHGEGPGRYGREGIETQGRYNWERREGPERWEHHEGPQHYNWEAENQAPWQTPH